MMYDNIKTHDVYFILIVAYVKSVSVGIISVVKNVLNCIEMY